jgi:hypothetical protein
VEQHLKPTVPRRKSFCLNKKKWFCTALSQKSQAIPLYITNGGRDSVSYSRFCRDFIFAINNGNMFGFEIANRFRIKSESIRYFKHVSGINRKSIQDKKDWLAISNISPGLIVNRFRIKSESIRCFKHVSGINSDKKNRPCPISPTYMLPPGRNPGTFGSRRRDAAALPTELLYLRTSKILSNFKVYTVYN